MLARQVAAHELGQLLGSGDPVPEAGRLVEQLLRHRGADEVLLGGEVCVEGAVGQSRVRHQGRDARTVDAIGLQSLARGLDDALPSLSFVVLAVTLVPAPYMALYSATKHALEGYCESVDHEVREHGVRVVLVEPAYTKTGFEANALTADQPLDLCDARRASFNQLAVSAIDSGDDPSVVAAVIVDAATTSRPRLRYPAGSVTCQVTLLRRFAPAAAFDKQIRKLNKLPA